MRLSKAYSCFKCLKGVFYEEVYYYVSLSFCLFFSAVCPEVFGQGPDIDLETKVDNMEKMLMELKGQLKQADRSH